MGQILYVYRHKREEFIIKVLRRCSALLLSISIIFSSTLANVSYAADLLNDTPSPVIPDWYVQIAGISSPFCSGALIEPSWVLTAKHCENSIDKIFNSGNLVINVGDPASPIVRKVDGWIEPESRIEGTQAADTLLVHLSSPINDVAPAKIINYLEYINPDNTSQKLPVPGQQMRSFGAGAYATTNKVNNILGLYQKNVLFRFSANEPVYNGFRVSSYDGGTYKAGDSGGPTIDADGNLIGIMAGGDGKTESSTATITPILEKQYAAIQAIISENFTATKEPANVNNGVAPGERREIEKKGLSS